MRRYRRLEKLLGTEASDLATLHGELALAFRQMQNNYSDPAGLERDAAWAKRAVASARRIGLPDLLSAALDAASAVELGRDEMARVLELAEERLRLAGSPVDRASAPMRGSSGRWAQHAPR